MLLEMMSLRQESSFGKEIPSQFNHLRMSFWSRSLMPTPVKYCKASVATPTIFIAHVKTPRFWIPPTMFGFRT